MTESNFEFQTPFSNTIFLSELSQTRLFSEKNSRALRDLMVDAGANPEEGKNPEVYASLTAPHFRAKPRVDSDGSVAGTLIYDRRVIGKTQWVELAPDLDPRSSREDGTGDFADRSYALVRILGTEKFERLIKFA